MFDDFDERHEDGEYDAFEETDGEQEGYFPSENGSVSSMNERPSILGDTPRDAPDSRPSIVPEDNRSGVGGEQRPSITGREEMPKPLSPIEMERARRRAEEEAAAREAAKSKPPQTKAQTEQMPMPQQPQSAPRQQKQVAPQIPARPAPPTPPQPRKSPSSPKRKALKEPAWLKRLRKDMPPFADEVLALLLIALGLISVASLAGLAGGDIAGAWARFLSRSLGLGAAMIPLVILVAGALLLVPKLGIKVSLNWQRIIAGEVFFLSLLSYAHLINPDPDPWAAALAGQGGGWVGWATSSALRDIIGSAPAGFIFLMGMVMSGGMALGVGRHQVIRVLDWLNYRAMLTAHNMELKSFEAARRRAAKRAARPAPPPPTPEPAQTFEPAPDLAQIPSYPGRPSIITGARGAGAAVNTTPKRGPSVTRTGISRSTTPAAPDAQPPQAEGALAAADIAQEAKQEEDTLETRHTFSVDDLQDQKKVGRRSKLLPPLELLDATDFERPSEDEINANATIIEDALEDFGLPVEVIGVQSGPTVTQYAVQPFTEFEVDGKKVVERVRVTRIASLGQDIALALSVGRVRIEAPVPGESYVGIEVPNKKPGIVSLRPVIESKQFYDVYEKSPVALALGRDVAGKPYAADLAQMPHLLIAGTTGSGKSIGISAMTTCLIANNSPHSLRLIMIDPKMVELIRFNGLPHLLGRVEVDLERIIGVLRWATREMDRRYKLLEAARARNIQTYNRRLGPRKWRQHLPYVAIMIDELADLMMFMPNETERVLVRLAQMARAVGMHLVVATQRPSTDVVTGLIKANFPARLSYAVASSTDSRVILDAVGAEQLIGKGDMLFFPPEAAGPVRLQGSFVGDAEMERVVDYWIEWQDAGKFDEGQEAPWEKSLTRAQVMDETDDLIGKALIVIQQEGRASASLLQRKLNVGFPRAARIMDSLHELGLIGEETDGGRTRDVLIDAEANPWDVIHEMKQEEEGDAS